MTETEWIASEDPALMLEHLCERPKSTMPGPFHGRRITDRKLRLFACGCCRLVWGRLADPRGRRAVEVAERYADGEATGEDMAAAFDDSFRALRESPGDAFAAASHACTYRPCLVYRVPAQIQMGFPDQSRARPPQAALLRCVAGNPWRPVTLREKPRLSRDDTGLLLAKGGKYTVRRCREHLRFDGSYNPAGREEHRGSETFWDGSFSTCEGCWRVFMETPSPLELERLAAPCPWLTPTVLALARAAYGTGRPCPRCEGRGDGLANGTMESVCPACHGAGSDGLLGPDRLAVLADALSDAGCEEESLLRHLRGEERCRDCKGAKKLRVNTTSDNDPTCWFDHDCHWCEATGWTALRGPHARGCWALDLILGRS